MTAQSGVGVSGLAPMTVGVNAHLYPETVISSSVVTLEGRATVHLGGSLTSGVQVTVFARRAELVRLRDALTAVLDELDTERAALAQTLTTDESAA